MGVIWYARNLETKKAYERGKGAWYYLSDDNGMIDASSVERLRDNITVYVITSEMWDKETVLDKEYHLKIAQDLNRLGDSLELVDDTYYSDDPIEGFELVGTRYTEATGD